jgi:dihydroflavonol-4-reductase
VEGGRRLTFPVFVPDVARIILRTLHRGRLGEVYNISDQSITHNALNQMVSDYLKISRWRFSAPTSVMLAMAAMQEGLAKITGREPFYPLNLRHYVFNDWNVSSAKARLELDFEPTPIEKGLQQTIDWYLEQKGK